MSTTAELAEVWHHFVEHETSGYSPLYTEIVSAMAADDEVLAFVLDAPQASHYPLMPLAAVHDLVLAGELPGLAAVYRGERPVDEAPALFRAALLDHRDDVMEVLSTRFVQTNECGRAAPLALALGALAVEPVALVDAGASAGLNLFYDRYRLDYGDTVLGHPASPVVCRCDVRGPAPMRLVDVPVRVGLDRSPVDVTDPVAARWLLACTWPDTGRLERTRAAVEIAAASPPDIRTGDLVEGIGPLLAGLDVDGTVCVVTSWALAYLSGPQRKGFVDALAGSGRPVVWLSLEGPGVVRGIDPGEPTTSFRIRPSVIGLTTFGSDGRRSATALAHVHPHGEAIEWVV